MRDAVPESADREVTKLNMTPMIDVVFQLLVFFLCSMKFKSLDMKLEAHLPKTCGPSDAPAPPPPPKVDVRLRRATANAPTEVRVGGHTFGDVASDATWERLRDHLVAVQLRAAGAGADGEVHGEVDASPAVATRHVIHALDVLKDSGFAHIRFTGTAPVR